MKLLHCASYFAFGACPPPLPGRVPTIGAHPLSFHLPLFLHHCYVISPHPARVFISVVVIVVLHNWAGVDASIPAPTGGGGFVSWFVCVVDFGGIHSCGVVRKKRLENAFGVAKVELAGNDNGSKKVGHGCCCCINPYLSCGVYARL